MTQKKHHHFASDADVHRYYMDIINCMPYVVYWVDADCQLKGCNHHFISLLGLEQMSEFSGMPYDLMEKWLPWTDKQIKSLKTNDTNALFSSKATYDVEEVVCNAAGDSVYYRVSRTPVFDAETQSVGLVVVMSDITAEKNMQHLLEQSKTADACTVPIKHLDYPLLILVVEDNKIAQFVEKSMFEELNCIVDIAASGDDATLCFSPGKYAFVLMDISLEETSGYAVTHSFRKMEENTGHKVPIVALTSHDAETVKEDCLYYTMEGAITKPLSHEQAMQIVRRYGYHENVVVNGLRSI